MSKIIQKIGSGISGRIRLTLAASPIVAMAATLAALAMVPPISLGVFGVPITLQTIGVSLAGMMLGPWRGFAAVTLYLAAGLAGLPIFAGGLGGFGILAMPSVGYLIAFPFAALVTGLFTRWSVMSQRRVENPGRKTNAFNAGRLFGGAVLGAVVARLLVIWPLGAAGMSVNLGLPYGAALAADLPFWPGDAAKIMLAAVLAVQFAKVRPRLETLLASAAVRG